MKNKFFSLSPDKNLSPTEYRALMTAAREIRAKNIRSKITNTENFLEENVDFSQKTSKSIATAGTQQGKLFSSDEQREIFEKISKTLETIAKSEKDTGKERNEIRKLMAKLIVKSDEEIAKLKDDIKAKKDEKSKLKESGLDTKKDKERYEKLDREIKKLYKGIEGQKGFQTNLNASQSQDEPEKRKTFSQSLGHGLSLEAKKIFPGLDFKPKKGESYSEMFGRNFAEATTGKGSLSKALFTVAPEKKKTPFSSILNSEKEASRLRSGRGFGPRGFGNELNDGIKTPSATLDKNGSWRENNKFVKAPAAIQNAPNLAQANTKESSSGMGLLSGLASGASSVGGAIASGASSVGGAIASGASSVGGAIASGASSVGGAALGVLTSAPVVGAAGLAAGLYAGDKMFNTSVAEGGSGTLGETYDLMTGKKEESDKKASNEKADMIAKQRGFSSFEEMKSHNRQMAMQKKVSGIAPTSGGYIEDMSEKAKDTNMPAPSVTNITNNTAPVASSSPTMITTTQVRDQGTTIQRIKEKRVFQN